MTDAPVYRYVLTRADALAFEKKRPLGRFGRVVFVIWLLAAGAELGIIAGDWNEDWRLWLLGAVLAGLHLLIALAVMALLARWRAGRRVPAPIPMTLADHGDRLAFEGAGRAIEVALADISAASLTRTHLIIATPPETYIVPRSAFPQPSIAADLLQRIDDAGRDD